jgi:acetylornithine deacetylase/succinyl-diaminopimelate desuccinylase-like protein
VNGIWGGFIGEGAKTVLPSKATAKISMRLVPHQKTDTIAALFEEHIRTIAPPTMKVKVTNLHGADPALTPRDSDGVKAAVKVCLLFDPILNAPTVLMGFGLNTENAHSPDEHFSLENFEKGIIATSVFYDEFLSIARGA